MLWFKYKKTGGFMKHLQIRAALTLLFLFCSLTISLPADPADFFNKADTAYQIKNTFLSHDYSIVQFYRQALSHYSYLVISAGRALCVDPGRDAGVYIEYAGREGLEWVGTLLTHTHSDFIAGHREMASKTGAPIYVSRHSNALYPHIEISDGDEIAFGNAVIKIIETPGHTHDSVCGLISSSSDRQGYEYVISGDTILSGRLGAPEPFGKDYSATSLAAMMFDTWHSKLVKLDDAVIVLPAHGEGSQTTIGKEKVKNIYLPFLENKDEFIIKIVSDMQPVADYLKETARINRAGPELISNEIWQSDNSPELPVSLAPEKNALPAANLVPAESVTAEQFFDMVNNGSVARIIDIRSPEDFVDYQIKASENLTAESLSQIQFKAGEKVVIVDRDGSKAAEVATALKKNSGEYIRFLSGGLRSYWNKIEMPEDSFRRAPVKKVPDANDGKDETDSLPAKQPDNNNKKGAGC